MSLESFFTTDYYGIPLWGWILLCFGLIVVVLGVLGLMKGKEEEAAAKGSAAEVDPETGMKMPMGHPPATPSPGPQFERDKPLPPPVDSPASHASPKSALK